MRDALTGLAVAIITLLTIALAGPIFIDWTGQRARIESVLAERLGVRVQIAGPIEVRFLPTPRLVVERAQFGERPGPVLGADRIAIEIGTMPLLKGEIRVLESRLSGARLTLTRQADGGFALPQSGSSSASIEKLFISDGRLQIRDPAGKVEIDLALSDVEADAGALAGPWRMAGRMRTSNETRDIRLALSAPDSEGQRVRLALIENDGDRTDFDGRLQWDRGTAQGKLSRQGRVAWPGEGADAKRTYLVTAQAHIAPRLSRADPLEIEIGDESGLLKLSGSAEWRPGTPIALNLEGKSLDFDRPLKNDGGALSAGSAVALWAKVVGNAVGEIPPLSVDLAVSNAILGGDALRAVAMRAVLRDNQLRIADLTADAPGATKLSVRGDLAFGAAPRFAGPVHITSRDPGRFALWLEGDQGQPARFPFRADLDADADLFITRDTIAASRLNFSYDRLQVTGAFRLQTGSERPKIDAQLASDRFGLESVPDFSGLGGRFGDLDALISFEARQLDFGQEWRGGKMRLRVEKTGARIALPLFEVTDANGLSVRGTGTLQGEGGRLDATLDLPQVLPLAHIAKRFGGGRVAEAVLTRAPSLSPFRGRVSLVRDGPAYRIEANGRAATTDLAATWRTGTDTTDGTFEIRAPEASGLLKQAGLTVLTLGRSNPARLSGTFTGKVDSPVVQARFESGQTRIVFDGGAKDNGVAGILRGESDDVTPWLQMLALPAPSIGERIAMQFSAQLANAEGLAFNAIDARIGTTKLRGQVTIQGDTIGGTLDSDSLNFETLTGLSLGSIPQAAAGSVWPSARFTPPVAPPFKTAITLQAPFIALPFGLRGDRPSMQLRWTPDGLELADIAFGFARGEWRGALALKRQGSLASFSSRTQWNGVDLAALLPQSGLTGRATMTLDLGASGESVAAMIVSLSGGGRARVEGGGMARLDARRVLPLIASADQGRDAPNPNALRDLVSTALDGGALSVDPFDTTLGVSNGVMRIGPATIQGAFSQGQALAIYDLKTSRLDARVTLQGTGSSDWTAPPQWSVQWRSLPNGTIARDIDVSTLANPLTTRYVARELQRIEAEEADLRERNFFIRRMRSEKMRYEEEVKRAEQKRAEDEAKKAREEAEKLLNIVPPPVEPAQPSFN